MTSFYVSGLVLAGPLLADGNASRRLRRFRKTSWVFVHDEARSFASSGRVGWRRKVAIVSPRQREKLSP